MVLYGTDSYVHSQTRHGHTGSVCEQPMHCNLHNCRMQETVRRWNRSSMGGGGGSGLPSWVHSHGMFRGLS